MSRRRIPSSQKARGNDVAKLPDLSLLKGKPKDERHTISFEFENDHDIGVKGEIMNVTPEQISVVILYLQRYALAGLAMRETLAMQAEAEAIAVQQSLAREKGN
jgi:hypothetical protein